MSAKVELMKTLITDGRNLTGLRNNMVARGMAETDVRNLADCAALVIEHLPYHRLTDSNEQGLLLGLVQSGKTGALTTVIALAADNSYQLFIVLTSDNTWLYNQTVERLQSDLPGVQIESKDAWESNFSLMVDTLRSSQESLILVATKNYRVLAKLISTLERLRHELGGDIPGTLIIDDEADQASLDTMVRRRVRNPNLEPGRINASITQMRQLLTLHTYLQVTATPQALFLQDRDGLYRPEFTVLVEPGQGYTGGDTFFALASNPNESRIRYIDQHELDNLLRNPIPSNGDIHAVPRSLRLALAIFYLGATIKGLQNASSSSSEEVTYSLLCHISQKKQEHEKASAAISIYVQYLKDGLRDSADAGHRAAVKSELITAYNDLVSTAPTNQNLPTLDETIEHLRHYIAGTSIQVLNSDRQGQPNYARRYNILVGGTKLARGVTIKNLLVTYYGRYTRKANMDTMLQHARMYGYRQPDLDVIRLFFTSEIEDRFQLINDSESALRSVIREHPTEEYRGILIGDSVAATRANVLNPLNMGSYAAGTAYFPRRPEYLRSSLGNRVDEVNRITDELYPQGTTGAVRITIDMALSLLNLIKSRPKSGLWDDRKIRMALNTLQRDTQYQNQAYLVVHRDVTRNPKAQENHKIDAILGSGHAVAAKFGYPTLFLYRVIGQNWDDINFWVPNLRFPEGTYALIFNLDEV